MSVRRDEFELAKNGRAVFELGTAQAYRVTGADAVRYLNGRLTNDIKSLAPGQGVPSLMLSPQGKIEAALIVAREEQSLTVALFPPTPNEFERELFRFKIADDVTLVNLQDVKIYAAPQTSELSGFCTARFGAFSGLFFFAPESAHTQTLSHLQEQGKRVCSLETLGAVRAFCGAVSYGTDFSSGTSVSYLDLESFVSSSKGCYAGQEVVETTASRGRAGRKIVSFSGAADREPETIQLCHTDKPVGAATTLAYLPWLKQFHGIASLKSDYLQAALTLGGSRIELRTARL